MSNKTEQINALMKREGWDRYTNDPTDRGGPTKWGITEGSARAYGYTGDMRDMPYSVAFDMYSLEYWDSIQLSAIERISEDLAVYMFDFGVNSGIEPAVEYLQRLLNVLNYEERHYADLVTDGIIGGNTLNALRAYQKQRGSKGMEVLASVYNGLRIGFLFDISEDNESQERFTYGWFKRVVEL